MGNERLIFLPTYNEKDNVGPMHNTLVQLGVDCDILFLDDNSPDGTGAILDRMAAEDPRVNVIHRSGKQGVGSAHLQGINWAYEHKYRLFISFDCDFTHPPEYIPQLLARQNDADLVIGSRYAAPKGLKGWRLHRALLTRTAHLLTRLVLRMPYDATTSYRLYRLDRIPRELFDKVSGKGYSFFFESLFILHRHQVSICEVPVVLVGRSRGSSKMGLREALVWGRQLVGLYLRGLRGTL